MIKKQGEYWNVTYSRNENTTATMLGFEYEVSMSSLYMAEKGFAYDRWNTSLEVKKKILEGLRLPSRYKKEWEGDGSHPCLEFKSCIAPLIYHKSVLKRTLEDQTYFNLHESGSDNTGGIHVHLNLNCGSPEEIVKMSNFIYSKKNHSNFIKLGRRHVSQRCYSSFKSSKYSWINSSFLNHPLKELFTKYPSHYNTLNFERYYEAHPTIEFRLFAALPSLIFPALEFVDCMVWCAKNQSEITWSSFKGATSAPRYKELNTLITKLEL